MKLIENWKEILRKAWSVKFALLSTALAVAEAVLPAVQSVIPPGVFAWLSAGVAIVGILSRVIQQASIAK